MMSNRLKEMGDSAAWHLLVSAAIKGAVQEGYATERKPGRGLSNTYKMTRDGKTVVASVRTTRDRCIAFPPLDQGRKWKTLNDVELVLVSAVDDPANPQNVDVFIFPAAEVRKRFDANYQARIKSGHKVRDNFGMWVMIDKGDSSIINQVGHSLAIDFPPVARFTLDELEAELDPDMRRSPVGVSTGEEPAASPGLRVAGPALKTVADVLSFAREQISDLTGMPIEAIRLDLKMGV